MTQIRYEHLQNSYVLADSGEFVFDIGTNDIVTRMDVELRATNGATSNVEATIADVMTSFELMDGSNVIVSLSGAELAGMVVNKTARMLIGIVSEAASVEQSLRFALDFGRWYADEELSLDCSKFANLQCRVKWNLAAIRAVGATGFATGTTRLTVLAHIMEGARNPVGYLSLKRHALFTTAASGEESITLPVDKPIRAIGIRSYEAGVGGLSGISNIKLSADEGKYKPLDLAVADYLQSLITTQIPYTYQHNFFAANGTTLYTLTKYRESVKLTTAVLDAIGEYTHANIGEGALVAMVASTGLADATARVRYGLVTGWLPFSLAYQGFGDMQDPNTWLPAPNYRNLKLQLEQNNAGASCSVVLEQLSNY
ncbi:MAG: hypothetical protein AB1744_00950 [Candidatus Zixiibacteriota bacterium]